MKLSLLLFGLSMILKFTALRFSPFRDHLKQKDYTGVIKTKDGKTERYFAIKDGKIKSKAVALSNPDFEMIWKDASSAFNVMTSGDQIAFMKAVSDGTVKTEGDATLAVWFLQSLEKMATFYQKKK